MAATFPFYHTVTNSAVRVTIQPGDGYFGWAQINNMSSARGAVVGGFELVAGFVLFFAASLIICI